MNNDDVRNYLPHRYPFLLIDKVLDFKAHTFLIAQKNVSNKIISFNQFRKFKAI